MSNYDRSVRIRGAKGGDQPISIILDYFSTLPFEPDCDAEVLKLFIHKHFFFALKAQGHPEEITKPIAYEAIGTFQGIIDSIREAAGIKDDSNSGKYLVIGDSSINGHGIRNHQSNGQSNGKKKERNSSGIDEVSMKQQFNEADDLFGLN